jgi:hypothetical protein
MAESAKRKEYLFKSLKFPTPQSTFGNWMGQLFMDDTTMAKSRINGLLLKRPFEKIWSLKR